MQKYLAKLLRVEESFGADTKIAENRDGLLCLKGEEDFILLLRKKQIVGEDGVQGKPVGPCDTEEGMDGGSMESPLCVKWPKDVNVGNACCSVRSCFHYREVNLSSIPACILEKPTMSCVSGF